MYTWDVFRDVNVAGWNFSCVFLDILQSPVINLTELGPFLLKLDIKEWMLFGKIERIIFAMRVVDRVGHWVIVLQFRGMLVMVIVMVVVFVMLFLMPVMALLSH